MYYQGSCFWRFSSDIPIVLTGYYGLMEWHGLGEMKFIGLGNYIKLDQGRDVLEKRLSFLFRWPCFLLSA